MKLGEYLTGIVSEIKSGKEGRIKGEVNVELTIFICPDDDGTIQIANDSNATCLRISLDIS